VACALIWIVHPLCTEIINYVVQRTESIMALFYLATLYSAIRAWGSGRPRVWQAAAIVACAAGMASKESMVTAPVAVLLYDLAYRPGPIRRIVQRRWGLYAGLAAGWAILAAIMLSGPRSKTVGLSLGISVFDYAKNQAVLIADYLKTAVWPHPLVFDYGYAMPLPEGTAGPFVAFALALVALATVSYLRRPALGYPAVWFFLILAPTSTIVPIVSEVGAERRMYLPLAGLVVLLVMLGDRILERLGRDHRIRWVGVAAVGVVAAGLGWTTHARNADYRSAETLWITAVSARPENPRAHNNLGRAIHQAGRAAEAVPHYRRALELDGHYSQAHFNLGVALADLGRSDEAIERYRRALELNPELARAHLNLGSELANRRRLDEAIGHFERAVRHAPEWATARHSLGRALRLTGRTEAAIEQLRKAVRFDPEHWESLSDIAWIRATHSDPAVRDPAEAVKLALRAVELTGRRRAIALDTLAAAYAATGRFEEAIDTARSAIDVAASDRTRREIAERIELYAEREPYREQGTP
jgi:tetratricopeptide (TPR) repeat protein